MGNEELDRRLLEFLGEEAEDRAAGFTVRALHKAVTTLTDRMGAHEKRFDNYRDENDRLHASHHKRLITLEAESNARAEADTLPPPRERLQSTHDLEALADRVAKAAIEGFKSPDKTPEDEVRAVVAEEEKAREERRELERLRAAEVERTEQAKREAEASQTRRRNIIAGIVTAVAATGVIELLRWLGTLHH